MVWPVAVSTSVAVADTLMLAPDVVWRGEASQLVSSGQLSPAITFAVAMTEPLPCIGVPPPQVRVRPIMKLPPAWRLNGALVPLQGTVPPMVSVALALITTV